jgi:hypothetical protein
MVWYGIGSYRIVVYRIVSYRIVSSQRNRSSEREWIKIKIKLKTADERSAKPANISYGMVWYRIVSYLIVSYRIVSYSVESKIPIERT